MGKQVVELGAQLFLKDIGSGGVDEKRCLHKIKMNKFESEKNREESVGEFCT